LFRSGERIDFAAFRCCIRDEFHCVVPRLGFWQIIKRLFGEDRVEVAQVRGNVLLKVRLLGVPFEGFREALGDSGGRADVLRLRQESSCPDAVSVFQLFIRELIVLVVGLKVGFTGSESGSVVILFYVLREGWERSSTAGVDPSDILLFRNAFLLKLSLTAGAASG